jgi:tripartite-type tricarboxylate transporter receptor subunit TctC
MRKAFHFCVAALAGVSFSTASVAAWEPTKPVEIVVAAGGGGGV